MEVADGAGLQPLRRLGQNEYARTLESLLGAEAVTSVRLPDDKYGASTYLNPTTVGTVERGRLEQAANEVVQNVAPQLPELAPCEPGADERACAESFITNFGKRAFRRTPGSARERRFVRRSRGGRIGLGFSYASGPAHFVMLFGRL